MTQPLGIFPKNLGNTASHTKKIKIGDAQFNVSPIWFQFYLPPTFLAIVNTISFE